MTGLRQAEVWNNGVSFLYIGRSGLDLIIDHVHHKVRIRERGHSNESIFSSLERAAPSDNAITVAGSIEIRANSFVERDFCPILMKYFRVYEFVFQYHRIIF